MTDIDMKKSIFLIVAVVMISLLGGCKSKKNENQGMAINAHEVKVQEFIQTTEYTYFNVKEGNQEYWMAAPKRENAKKGETLYYTTSWPMADWESPELGRTWDLVHFIQDLSETKPVGTGMATGGSGVHTGTPRNQGMMGQQQVSPQPDMNGPAEVEGTVEEELSIHEILSNSKEYKNKLVTVSGKVIKVNNAIMSRNWVHITDEDGHEHDLTITTQETFEIDQDITIQGQVSIDRDFGAGYKYEVILENGRLVK